jgi:hypothetical protein
VVSFTPRPLYPRERAPGTHCIGGWVDPRAGLDNMEKWKYKVRECESYSGCYGIQKRDYTGQKSLRETSPTLAGISTSNLSIRL